MTNQRGAMLQKEVSDQGTLNVLGGKQVQRYFISNDTKGKIAKSQINDEKAYIKNNTVLVQNIVAHVMKPQPRVIIIATVPDIDIIEKNIILDTVNQLTNKSKLSNKFILAVLGSNLICWYVYRFIFANAIRTMHFDNGTTEKIPFPILDLKNAKDKKAHDEVVKLVEKMCDYVKKREATSLAAERSRLQEHIDYTEMLLNKAVYEIYRLTDDEIRVVEG